MSRQGEKKLVRVALPALCVGVIQCGMLAAAASAAPAQSAYSQLDWESGCTVLDRAAQDEPGAWAKLVCDGHAGYPVFVSDDGGRMSLDYGFVGDGARWESFASFNRVHDTIEWRLAPANAGARPFATIHRWFVSGDGGGERQVLVVSSVAQPEGGRSCMVGFVDAANPDANRLAQRVADEQARRFRCGTDTPSYHGATSQRSPQPSIAAE